MAYISADDVATYLGETLTALQIAQVDALIPAVEAAANTYTNRRWGVAGAQTETFDGGKTLYFLSLIPITTVSSIAVDGETLTSDQYYLYPGYIRLASPATRAFRNVVITYTANVPLPADVKQALIQWVAEIFKADRGSSGVVKRAQFGPGEVEYFAPSTTTDASKLPSYVQTVLDRYRLMPV